MNEKQARRIHKAQRAWVKAHKHELSTGPSAASTALGLTSSLHTLWARLNHRGRGIVSHALLTRDLPSAVRAAVRVLS
jgi:uncharacterized protein YecT (DUF1311 family)